MSEPRNLKMYEVTELVFSDGIFKNITHDLLAPSDSVALEFIRSESRGTLVSIVLKNRETYIVDYEEPQNEDNMETELKYQVLPVKQENKG